MHLNSARLKSASQLRPADQRKTYMTKAAASTRRWSIPLSTANPAKKSCTPPQLTTSDQPHHVHPLGARIKRRGILALCPSPPCGESSSARTNRPWRICRRQAGARRPPRPGTAARQPGGRRAREPVAPWRRRLPAAS